MRKDNSLSFFFILEIKKKSIFDNIRERVIERND